MKNLAKIATLTFFLSGCTSAGFNEGLSRLAFAPPKPSSEISTSSLFLDEMSTTSELKKDDHFQINLVSAYICDFRESSILALTPSRSQGDQKSCRSVGKRDDRRRHKTRGEIALLAGFAFRSEDAKKSNASDQRLIYYNDDVRESGQLLNFVNIPIFGPAKLELAASRLNFTVLEMDKQDNATNKHVLGQVAKIGAAVASPAAAPSLKVLTEVGSALIEANGDDRELAFDVGFDAPRFAGSKVHRLSLREGYFAIVRREKRGAKDHFTKLRICPGEGVISDKPCGTGNYYSGSTWMLMRVSLEDPKITKAIISRKLTDLVIDQKTPLSDSLVKSILDFSEAQ